MKKLLIPASLALLVAAGCHRDMWAQPKVKAQGQSNFYADHRGSRIAPKGTVSFGEDTSNVEFLTGYTPAGRLVKEFPVIVDRTLLERGKERYEIFCTPCHGQVGDGNGMIAQRGFKVAQQPADYHTDRLRNIPVGHFFDVMTNGSGAMFSFAGRIKPQDRWAIAAYIKALQKSQNVKVSDLGTEDMEKLMGGGSTPSHDSHGDPQHAEPSHTEPTHVEPAGTTHAEPAHEEAGH